MKKSIFLIILVLTFSLLVACDEDTDQLVMENLHESFFRDLDKSSDINIYIDEEITTSSETFEITYENNSENEYTYDEEPHLEYFVEDNWYIVPLKQNASWTDLNYILLAKDKYTGIFPIEKYYGNLIIGKYRIVKMFNDYEKGDSKIYSIVEFEVKE